MRRVSLVVSVLFVLTSGLTASTASAKPAAACNEQSWIGGQVDLCDGALVYRDYVFDDYGADDPLIPFVANTRTGNMSHPIGDQRYARDVNSADLVELRLRVAHGRLRASFELNALYSPDSTVAVLAIDTDDDRSTGGGGWSTFGVKSTGWDVLHTFDRGDPASNLITGSVPLPPGDRWRVQAVTAVNGGPVMNVAFRGVDERTVLGTWWEDNQAAALSVVNGGDISAFGQTVNVGDLRAGVTRPGGPYTGFHERVFTSAFTLPPGEGMSYTAVDGRAGPNPMADPIGITANQGFHYLGRYQPYGVYIPKTKPGPHGVQVMMHGGQVNHAFLVDQPGVQAHLGEEVNRVILSPLGRGPRSFYTDISEADVLEALADVKANYDIDHERVFMGGYSMGGYGALRLGALYPHLFAGFIDWVGGGTGPVGNPIDFVGNLRHVPGAMLFSTTDIRGAEALAEQFRASDNEYIYYMHAAGDHIVSFPTADDWRKEAAWTKDLVRVTAPSRVTYRMDESFWNADYGIRHDRAYWVSGIRSRGAGFADTDVTTHACGRMVPSATTGRSAGAQPIPWVADFRELAPGDAAAPERRLEATLANVASLEIDASAACLAGASVTYRVSTDGPVTLSLSDGRSLSLQGAGLHEGTLERRHQSPPRRGRVALPATR